MNLASGSLQPDHERGVHDILYLTDTAQTKAAMLPYSWSQLAFIILPTSGSACMKLMMWGGECDGERVMHTGAEIVATNFHTLNGPARADSRIRDHPRSSPKIRQLENAGAPRRDTDGVQE